MFSLLITIFAIALVAALAAAVIYYGGDASSRATVRNASNTLFNQAAQINAAGTMAVANGVGWPESAPIFAEPFVKAMPLPPRSAYVDGIVPAQTDWEYYLNDGSTKHFVLRNKIKRDVCLAVNREMGVEGIPAAWDGKTIIQCYGTGAVVDGAYTFFYDPPSSTPSENTAALAQSLTEGGTVVPGYPRLCADGSTIATGLCAPLGSESGNGGQPGDGTGGEDGGGEPGGGDPGNGEEPPADGGGGSGDPIAERMDGMGSGYPSAPDEQYCLDAPTAPECDASRYNALRIDNFPSYMDVQFTAIKDCSMAASEGYLCIPAFNSLSRTWYWTPPTETLQEGQENAIDGRMAYRAFYKEGFTISDGINVWTVSSYNEYGTTYQYIDIQEFPTYTSPDRFGALAVDCKALQANLAARGAYFLEEAACVRIETGSQYSWNFIYDNMSIPRGNTILRANPTWTFNYQLWGEIDAGDLSWTHMTIHAPSGIGGLPFYIGAIPTDLDDDIPLHVAGGAIGTFPYAPLVTTTSPREY